MKNFVLGLFVILALSGFAAAQEVAGAWRLDEATMPGTGGKTSKFSNPNIYLFTKGHFSIIRVEGYKPRSTDPWMSMTRDQLIDTYTQLSQGKMEVTVQVSDGTRFRVESTSVLAFTCLDEGCAPKRWFSTVETEQVETCAYECSESPWIKSYEGCQYDDNGKPSAAQSLSDIWWR
jgi:hypothetical protein